MSNSITPYIINAITSNKTLMLKRALAERKRKRNAQPHLVTVFLRINDPYSYLLLQVLEKIRSQFSVEYEFRTILNLQEDMYPALSLWEKNAFNDGLYLSDIYSLTFPVKPPVSDIKRDNQLTAQLLHWELQPGYQANALELFHGYWNNDQGKIDAILNLGVSDHVECYQHHLTENQNKLKSDGHYLSAMLHYGGEWYWGLDRLEYLEKRLTDLNLSSLKDSFSDLPIGLPKNHSPYFNKTYQNFCKETYPKKLKTNAPIEIYWSIRSPYSYIGLERAIQLSNHYKVPLVVKPVLPMVMRRMIVPNTKRFYIIEDCKREANKHNLKFGLVADPLGKGVERCYALYEYACSEGKEIEYLQSYARGVWSQGIRSDTDKGLKIIVENAGLNWKHAKSLLNSDTWRVWAQDNLAQMYHHDLWGVPSFKYKNITAFGQDRLEYIERAIINQ